MATHLILGGARSGKSAYAEALAAAQAQAVTYLATANIQDEEMRQRITHHQQRRPAHWHTLELAQGDLAVELNRLSSQQACVILDCLTLWLMTGFEAYPALPEQAITAFLEAVERFEGALLIVSNEISMGVVPMGALSRDYVDTLGRLHQRIAAKAERVTLMVAGIALAIKSPPTA
ncbi:MAG: bifunctional adenosylcobinamide kinase/adenosylcobinamide-phosphate guanylyltransferase [Thiomicrospira sp.]